MVSSAEGFAEAGLVTVDWREMLLDVFRLLLDILAKTFMGCARLCQQAVKYLESKQESIEK